MFFSFGLSLGWLWMVVWIVVVHVRVIIMNKRLVRKITILAIVVRCLRVVWLRSVWISMHRILIIKIVHSIRAAWEVRCIRTVSRIAIRIVSIRLAAMRIALHRTIMLLCAHVEMLVRLLALYSLWPFVLWGRFSSDRLNMSRLESVNTMTLFWIIRLHL